MNATVEAGKFSGSILVAKDGKVLVSRGYGMANLEDETPNTSQTKFRIASLTKMFTAAAIMILQERGKLNVQDSICKFLPDCPQAWQPVTVHHLLTHTSGIPNNTDAPISERASPQTSSVTGTVARLKNKPLEFTPGARFSYSNSGYILLGYIIEKLSGQSYESFLSENIFRPLKMASTGYDHNQQILKRRAAGYSLREGIPINAAYIDMSLPFSAGGLYSTVADMYIWAQAVFAGKVMSKKSLEEMLTPLKGDYAYGWVNRIRFNRRQIGNAGKINGFTCHFMYYPEDKLSVIVLSNFDTTRTDIISTDLAAIMFGEKYNDPRENH